MITAYRPPDHIQGYFGKRFYPMGTTCIFLFLLAQLRGGLSVILHLSGAVNRSLKLGQLEFIGSSFYFKWHSCFLYHIALFRIEDQSPRTSSGIQRNLLKHYHLTDATGKLRWSVWTHSTPSSQHTAY